MLLQDSQTQAYAYLLINKFHRNWYGLSMLIIVAESPLHLEVQLQPLPTLIYFLIFILFFPDDIWYFQDILF